MQQKIEITKDYCKGFLSKDFSEVKNYSVFHFLEILKFTLKEENK